eukprot:TRINITY_DN3718_c0_g1_i1.p1 TRINITY_DN3718_c0_g1~~TRINITY_DN3718_c0_g1_i1.p1  ORF type:complete len:2396 (-),score=658.91 TRINITY_DN3718_c0_g1_i1:129-7316(-)
MRLTVFLAAAVAAAAALGSLEVRPYGACEDRPIDIVFLMCRSSSCNDEASASRGLGIVEALYTRSGCPGNNSLGYVAWPPVSSVSRPDYYPLGEIVGDGIAGLHQVAWADLSATSFYPTSTALRDALSAAGHVLADSYRRGRRAMIVIVGVPDSGASFMNAAATRAANSLHTRGVAVSAVVMATTDTAPLQSDAARAILPAVSHPARRNILYSYRATSAHPTVFDPRSPDCCLSAHVCAVSAALQVRAFSRESFSVSTPGDFVLAAGRASSGAVEVRVSVAACPFPDLLEDGEDAPSKSAGGGTSFATADGEVPAAERRHLCVVGLSVANDGLRESVSITTRRGASGPTVEHSAPAIGYSRSLSNAHTSAEQTGSGSTSLASFVTPFVPVLSGGVEDAAPVANATAAGGLSGPAVSVVVVGRAYGENDAVKVTVAWQAGAMSVSVLTSAEMFPHRVALCGAPNTAVGEYVNPSDRLSRRLPDGTRAGADASFERYGVPQATVECPSTTTPYRALDRSDAGLARLVYASRMRNAQGDRPLSLPSYAEYPRPSPLAANPLCTQVLGSGSTLAAHCSGNARVRMPAPVDPPLRLAMDLCWLRCFAPDEASQVAMSTETALPLSGATTFSFQRWGQNEITNDVVSPAWCEEHVCVPGATMTVQVSGQPMDPLPTTVSPLLLPAWYGLHRYGGLYARTVSSSLVHAAGSTTPAALVRPVLGGEYVFEAAGNDACHPVRKNVTVSIRCVDVQLKVNASISGHRRITVHAVGGAFPPVALLGTYQFVRALETPPLPQVWWDVVGYPTTTPVAWYSNTTVSPMWTLAGPRSVSPTLTVDRPGVYTVGFHVFDGCLVKEDTVEVEAVCGSGCAPDVYVEQAESFVWRGRAAATWAVSFLRIHTSSGLSSPNVTVTPHAQPAEAAPVLLNTTSWNETAWVSGSADEWAKLVAVSVPLPTSQCSGSSQAHGAVTCSISKTLEAEMQQETIQEYNVSGPVAGCAVGVYLSSSGGSWTAALTLKAPKGRDFFLDAMPFSGTQPDASHCYPTNAPVTKWYTTLTDPSEWWSAPSVPEVGPSVPTEAHRRSAGFAHFGAAAGFDQYWVMDSWKSLPAPSGFDSSRHDLSAVFVTEDVCTATVGRRAALALPPLEYEGHWQLMFDVAIDWDTAEPVETAAEMRIETAPYTAGMSPTDPALASQWSTVDGTEFKGNNDPRVSRDWFFNDALAVVRGPAFFRLVGTSANYTSSRIWFANYRLSPLADSSPKSCAGTYDVAVAGDNGCAVAQDQVTITADCGPRPLVQLLVAHAHVDYDYAKASWGTVDVTSNAILKPSLGNQQVGFGTDGSTNTGGPLPVGVVSTGDVQYTWTLPTKTGNTTRVSTSPSDTFPLVLDTVADTTKMSRTNLTQALLVRVEADDGCQTSTQDLEVYLHCAHDVAEQVFELYLGTSSSGDEAGRVVVNNSAYTQPSPGTSLQGWVVLPYRAAKTHPEQSMSYTVVIEAADVDTSVTDLLGMTTPPTTLFAQTVSFAEYGPTAAPVWNTSATGTTHSARYYEAAAFSFSPTLAGTYSASLTATDGCVQRPFVMNFSYVCPISPSSPLDGSTVRLVHGNGNGTVIAATDLTSYEPILVNVTGVAFQEAAPNGTLVPTAESDIMWTAFFRWSNGTQSIPTPQSLATRTLQMTVPEGDGSIVVAFVSSRNMCSIRTYQINVTTQGCASTGGSVSTNRTSFSLDSEQVHGTVRVSLNYTEYVAQVSTLTSTFSSLLGVPVVIQNASVAAHGGVTTDVPFVTDFTVAVSSSEMRTRLEEAFDTPAWLRSFGASSIRAWSALQESVAISVSYVPNPVGGVAANQAPAMVMASYVYPEDQALFGSPITCCLCGSCTSNGCSASTSPSCAAFWNATGDNVTTVLTRSVSDFARSGQWNISAQYSTACGTETTTTTTSVVDVVCAPRASASAAASLVAVAAAPSATDASRKAATVYFGDDGPRTFPRVNLTGNLSTVWYSRLDAATSMSFWYVTAAPTGSYFAPSDLTVVKPGSVMRNVTHKVGTDPNTGSRLWTRAEYHKNSTEYLRAVSRVQLLSTSDLFGSTALAPLTSWRQASFVPDVPGDYTLTFSAADGCTQVTDTVTVTASCTRPGLAALSTATWADGTADVTVSVRRGERVSGTAGLVRYGRAAFEVTLPTGYRSAEDGMQAAGRYVIVKWVVTPVAGTGSYWKEGRESFFTNEDPSPVAVLDPIGRRASVNFVANGTYTVHAVVHDGCTNHSLPARTVHVGCDDRVVEAANALTAGATTVYVNAPVVADLGFVESQFVEPGTREQLDALGCVVTWNWRTMDFRSLPTNETVYTTARERPDLLKAAPVIDDSTTEGVVAWFFIALALLAFVSVLGLGVALCISMRGAGGSVAPIQQKT